MTHQTKTTTNQNKIKDFRRQLEHIEYEMNRTFNTKFHVQSSTIAHDMKRTKVAYSISPLENGGSLINFPSQPPTSLPPPVSPVTPPTLTISDE